MGVFDPLRQPFLTKLADYHVGHTAVMVRQKDMLGVGYFVEEFAWGFGVDLVAVFAEDLDIKIVVLAGDFVNVADFGFGLKVIPDGPHPH